VSALDSVRTVRVRSGIQTCVRSRAPPTHSCLRRSANPCDGTITQPHEGATLHTYVGDSPHAYDAAPPNCTRSHRRCRKHPSTPRPCASCCLARCPPSLPSRVALLLHVLAHFPAVDSLCREAHRRVVTAPPYMRYSSRTRGSRHPGTHQPARARSRTATSYGARAPLGLETPPTPQGKHMYMCVYCPTHSM